jgi:hypothetical protein
VATTCLYPSFDIVHVFITAMADGFQVHDAGGAANSSWEHGRDDQLIKKEIDKAARRFKLRATNNILCADVISHEWLPNAVLSVANASAMAANTIVSHIAAAVEEALSDKIFYALATVYPLQKIAREFEYNGKSGKSHKFDFALSDKSTLLLLDAISPHHISIASKYVAFSDVKASHENAHGFAVFDRPLGADDASLMQQVADLVPLAAVSSGAKRIIA